MGVREIERWGWGVGGGVEVSWGGAVVCKQEIPMFPILEIEVF